ncbi:nonribosomal peptide synthetase [Hahella sp. CCB-MM4]|uniref:WS/DGAT/MGAT family O-acyltransferase n=1 Tax=Hahella sp. (strain CCB-MM4) TaxID=1926491 RepID=UPI000B9B51C7|nr:wax ester/triacylglycerol synthase family O-acyltransferase [Hahella sp. CCB-MM4]OZG75473.1 nonribosomal peptide synthetase [Hahella sp. CCB-MM4]
MSDTSFEPVNGVDAAWLRLDRPTNNMVITAMAVVEPIKFSKFKELVRTRFLTFSRFLKVPRSHSGVYLWEPAQHFSLDYHVRRVALPEPADKKTLQEFIGEQMSTPLDPTKPMWQFVLVENYQGQHVAVMRVHHSYADGLSLAAVFGSISDQTPNIDPFPGQESVKGTQQARQALSFGIESLARAVEKCTRLSYRLTEEGRQMLQNSEYAMDTIRSGLNGAAELAKLAALPSDNARSLRRSLGVMKSCSWSEAIPLTDFKQVAQSFGCTINDVLLACVSGGLRQLLVEREDDVDELRVHATLPVNLRPLETRAGRVQLHELGNQFGTVFVPLAAQIGNPVERLYKVKHDMMALKESMQPTLSHTLLAAIGLVPQGVQESLLELFSNKTSMVLSNVPAARRARYLAGSQVKELMFWVPQAGDIGLGLSLLSYNGGVQIGINVDRELIDEPEDLINAIVASFEEYKSLTSMAASTNPKYRKRRS